jgi:ABC-type polar amino acid transport system ATPase subunit
MITGKNVSWHYKGKQSPVPILKDVSFGLGSGKITAFMGPSGAGKTTLLKCIAGLHTEYEGEIASNGLDLKTLGPKERAAKIGFVLQQFHLFPHLTVLNNCTLALTKAFGTEAEEAAHNATAMLAMLGMEDFAHAFPCRLSGGQQQRAAIARALVLQPEVLLLDEPTSALDPESKKSLVSLLLSLQAKGFTIALSSHDMPFIRALADTVYFMEKGALAQKWDRGEGALASEGKINQFLYSN